jgi:hypothetical protein
MEPATRIEYSIGVTKSKEPGRHFGSSLRDPPEPPSAEKRSSVKPDAFDLFENQYSKNFEQVQEVSLNRLSKRNTHWIK